MVAQRQCSAEGCDRKAVAKGMCHNHWRHMRRHGSVAPAEPEVPTDFCVYALLDPDGTVRYVGTTINLRQRIKQHRATRFSDRKETPVVTWIKSLPDFPGHVVLEELHGLRADANERERDWLDRYPVDQLVNVYRDGRYGRVGKRPEAVQKMADARRGWKPSEETRRRLRETLSRTDLSKSDDFKANASANAKKWCAENSVEPTMCEDCGKGPYRGKMGLRRHHGSCPEWRAQREKDVADGVVKKTTADYIRERKRTES